MMRLTVSTFLAATLMLGSGFQVLDAQQPDDEGMQNWMAYMTPGENHKMLEKRSGDWNLSLKMWMLPGQPPSESKATSQFKMIMDGRFLLETVQGEFEGTTFHGQGTTAFDNGTKKFVSTWIDNMSTGMMISEGTYHADKKEFHYETSFTDPMTHKRGKGRTIDRVVDDNTFVVESYKTGPDGKEFKDMEITYTRSTK